MFFTLSLVFAIIFLLLFRLFFNNLKQIGTDHFFHLRLSDEIRKNNNKLITHFPHLIPNTPIYYPQLYHKFLSYFNRKFIDEKGYIFNYVFNFLIIVILGIIVNFNSTIWTDDKLKVFIIFITTPFFFVFWNAKNWGISGRTFGLFIGQLYFIVLYVSIHTPSYYYYILLVFISSIAWFGSNFSFQAIVIISFFLSFQLYENIISIVFPPIVGFLIWYLINYKVAKTYYKELYRLKKMFYKKIIYTMSLNVRPSVWGDFIYGFYRKYREGNHKDIFIYIYTNPIVSAILGFPAVFLILLFLINSNKFDYISYKIVLSGLMAMLSTSFRKTRFLGEPERYLEFVLPFSSLLFLYIDFKYFVIATSINFILLLFNYFINSRRKRENSLTKLKINIDEFYQKFNLSIIDNIKIISNDENIIRILMSYENVVVFSAYISKPQTLDEDFDNIYEKFGNQYKPKALATFYNYTQYDYLIIKSNNIEDYLNDFISEGKINAELLEKVEITNDVHIYKIRSIAG